MAYSYYQQTSPGWDTNQYQFGPPPPLTFQPQPSWGGHEFYRAHAATADPYLFDQAWNRVREYGGAPAGGMGVGLHEARHWHRRAYGPQNEIGYLSPEELGHAAAYEAYRSWIYNKHVYEPLSGDIERQREALTALAVAEATRLLQYSAHPMDQYARVAATEAAAHTANYIFYQTREEDYRSRSRFRTMDDPYARDDELLYPTPYGGHARSHSRHARSLSRHRAYSQSGGGMGGGMVIPPYAGQGYPSSAMAGMPQAPFPGQSYSGYGASQVPGMPYGVPVSAGSAYGPPMGMPISPSYNTGMVPGMAPSYSGSTLGGGMYTRTRSNSFNSYPVQPVSPYGVQQATPYMGSAVSMGSTMGMPTNMQMPTTGGQTIVIRKARRHKHKRSHSSDRDYDDTRSHHSSRY